MKHQFKNLHFWAVIVGDIILLAAATLAAYTIRFEGNIPLDHWENFKSVLPFIIVLKLGIFFFFGLYRGMWRYTSLFDLLNILKACSLAIFIALGIIVMVNRFNSFSRAVFVLDGLLTFFLITGSRVLIRLYYQGSVDFVFGRLSGAVKNKKNLLIIGAGNAAEKVLREIHDSKTKHFNVVGFLDDDRSKIGKRIHNISVLGMIAELNNIVEKTETQEILIAIPSAGREQMSRIIEVCRKSELPFKTLPSISEIIDGKISIKAIRDVSYKDLLGRPKVVLELDKIKEILGKKTILVTGAGGSIGSELCRQILRFNPGRLILFDSSEHNLYQIEMEIRHEHGFENYETVLGQVQDQELLGHVFNKYKPEIVFHAAAYKHVPMLEQNPWEAVSNNILATKSLMDIALQQGVEKFILVSTDKAVRPTNVMGASKRVTELLMQGYCMEGAGCRVQGDRQTAQGKEIGLRTEDAAKQMPLGYSGLSEEIQNPESSIQNPGPRTRMMAVRFGNVLGSSGSVIPLFRRQIEIGGPVTVTDPKVTRYFMSIEEAAQLILQAASMEDEGLRAKGSGLREGEEQLRPQTSVLSPKYFATGGEIFILEMGTPINIAQMARDLIRLCGKEPDTEIEIKYIGLRPGEKLYEELITEGEGIVPTRHEKIMVLKPNGFKNAECRMQNAESGKTQTAPVNYSTIQPFNHLTCQSSAVLYVDNLLRQIEELETLANAHDGEGIRAKLKEIVKDYSPKES